MLSGAKVPGPTTPKVSTSQNSTPAQAIASYLSLPAAEYVFSSHSDGNLYLVGTPTLPDGCKAQVSLRIGRGYSWLSGRAGMEGYAGAGTCKDANPPIVDAQKIDRVRYALRASGYLKDDIGLPPMDALEASMLAMQVSVAESGSPIIRGDRVSIEFKNYDKYAKMTFEDIHDRLDKGDLSAGSAIPFVAKEYGRSIEGTVIDIHRQPGIQTIYNVLCDDGERMRVYIYHDDEYPNHVEGGKLTAGATAIKDFKKI